LSGVERSAKLRRSFTGLPNFSDSLIRTSGIAIVKPAHCTYPGCETAKTQLRLGGLSSLAPVRTIFVVVCAMGVTGCAHYPAQRGLEATNAAQVRAASVRVRAHVRVHSKERQHAELRGRQAAKLTNLEIRANQHDEAASDDTASDGQATATNRPDPSLLAPQPDPNCDSKKISDGTDLLGKWARLEIERQCYRDAEKAAREHVNQLQEYLSGLKR
jgi:hypothetical protein